MRKKNHNQQPEIPLTTAIESFSHDGRGIARIQGKTTFIQDALAGETVEFQYVRKKRDYDEGRVVSVMSASSLRTEPLCPHYHMCGGCSMQHMNEEAQIHVKETLLLDSLRRIGHVEPERMLPPLLDSSWHYRNKARLSVRFIEKKQSTLVGFREKNNPRYITEISQCPVLNRRVDAEIVNLRGLLDSLDVKGVMAQIEVAAGDDEVALVFRNLAELSVGDQEKLRQFGQSSGFTLFLQPGSPDSITRFYPETGSEFLQYTLPEEGLTFKFHPLDFTQVNAGLNRRMVAQAMTLMDLNTDDVVLDLFCGLGNFSLPMAKRCHKVIGFEGGDNMVLRAKMNASENHLDNTEFYCANLDQADFFTNTRLPKITKILIDPPRTGALEIVRQIDKLKPKAIVYVSCNPATLARDSDVLVHEQGYRLKAAGVMDMFPHTAHVESIALFEKD